MPSAPATSSWGSADLPGGVEDRRRPIGAGLHEALGPLDLAPVAGLATGLVARKVRRRRGLTPGKRPAAPDFVRRDFTAEAPDLVWCADMTVARSSPPRTRPGQPGGGDVRGVIFHTTAPASLDSTGRRNTGFLGR
ncbi:hypothetical protein OHT76_43780 [Streptomyces sp. NBC_00287]|uniref:hypothetical protein n=1 Tax=Streptomyces sp. NBC_00287 TaxID=2975702 RepID=UPI002E2D35F8|nr:hypothetical protein [Streptomyces sp. NBC_00287]